MAKFHGREDTILYASCFDANAGLFEAILTPEDAVFSDELNHASIIDGIRLCKAQKNRYKHRDLNGKYETILRTFLKYFLYEIMRNQLISKMYKNCLKFFLIL